MKLLSQPIPIRDPTDAELDSIIDSMSDNEKREARIKFKSVRFAAWERWEMQQKTQKPAQKNGHRKPQEPSTTSNPSPRKGTKADHTRGASRKGRGFTREEQLRGASKGGKARWAGVSKAKRQEAARKAVMARWSKSK